MRLWPSWVLIRSCCLVARGMPEHTFLAFDYGTRKIGVAIGNALTRHARPLSILTPVTRQQRFDQIQALLLEWQPDVVVVGLPLTSCMAVLV